ncbi:uncharacterized protein BJ171DRAFT_509611 [Polychytrium aggregatum]|uniref:uncharacterized protein n=1 Tax=Polychytrium aggregatum TaxID=110093 RepID=UPI0022FE663B|nr:uncharacterized protein BJ171DRAFT_509611 [Polychytrium aggregatum]KAI9203409.1 hypothetical protein BJ171DRAFT_509611 [Polychytrium aggregatum]
MLIRRRLLLLLLLALLLVATVGGPLFLSSPVGTALSRQRALALQHALHHKDSCSPKKPFAVIVTAIRPSLRLPSRYEAVSIANKRQYCCRQGCDLIVVRSQNSSSANPAWAKIEELQRQFAKYEWIWVIDLDAYIMNKSIGFEEIVGVHGTNREIIIAQDYPAFVVNAGSFFVHSSPYTIRFVEEWFRHHQERIHLFEQAVFASLFTRNYMDIQDRTALVPLRTINSYCPEHLIPDFRYQPGDFVVHFPGQCKGRQHEFVNRHFDSIIR